jgi:hypothetical protein
MSDVQSSRRNRGFERAAGLVEARIRAAGETRGFAVAKVLTHWAEVAGPDMARRARPVKVSYPPTGGLGATLTLLVRGSEAPFVEMQKEALRQRVNACYGYNAIARIRLTQTAPQGFAEPAAAFVAAPPLADPAVARKAAEGVRDDGLRAALEEMGRTILSGAKPKEP